MFGSSNVSSQQPLVASEQSPPRCCLIPSQLSPWIYVPAEKTLTDKKQYLSYSFMLSCFLADSI